jgi:hypothetical protein
LLKSWGFAQYKYIFARYFHRFPTCRRK